MSPQESRPAATNCETAKDVSAGSVKSVPIVPQPTVRAREARPTFAQRLQRRRRVAGELDRLLDRYRYPDPAVLYAIAPSRERVDEGAMSDAG